ncbi:MAG TPA: lytic transglycosylase domain-containing protein [Terriglobia bacterium]
MKTNWKPAALITASALVVSVVSATFVSASPSPPQDHIALTQNAGGQVAYVNAGDWGRPDPADPLPGDSNPPNSFIRQLIGQTARSLAVDPKLVDAVMRVESGYDIRARSPKGALGLMQLVPATASRFGVQDPFDPAENIRGGVSYLGELLKRFNGEVPLTLAAYNAGEGAVSRRQGIPPFEETQNYVRKVRAVYPAPSAALRSQSDAGTPNPKLPSSSPGSAHTRSDPVSPAPIYRYVDARGVTHFAQ